MSIRTQGRDSWIGQLTNPLGVRLVLLSLLLGGVVGCAPQATQPVNLTTPMLPVEATQPVGLTTPTLLVEATVLSGWETYTNEGQCGYAISHPSDMDAPSQDLYSRIWSRTTTEPSGIASNFVYVSVIPGDFQGGPGVIYNYDPVATETLLNMQVGESGSLYDDPNLADMAPWFTYTRLPDKTLSNQVAKMYENNQPWEAPPNTKEIRYYLQANGCTYLIGGFLATVDSGEPRAINEELFDEIIATFQVKP